MSEANPKTEIAVEPPHSWFEFGLMTSPAKEVDAREWIGYERQQLVFNSERSPHTTVDFPANDGRKTVVVTHGMMVRCTENDQFVFTIFQLDTPCEIQPGIGLRVKVKNVIPIQSVANPITIGMYP